MFIQFQHNVTAWKLSKYEVVFGLYFPLFSPSTKKYGPEKPPHLDTFHAVNDGRNIETYKFQYVPLDDALHVLFLILNLRSKSDFHGFFTLFLHSFCHMLSKWLDGIKNVPLPLHLSDYCQTLIHKVAYILKYFEVESNFLVV